VTTLTVLAAAAACVVVGFFVLRSITEPAGSDELAGGGPPSASTTASTAAPTSVPATSTTSSTTSTSSTSTTSVPVSRAAATVMVANASGVDRSATAMADELDAAGYATAPVANATGPRIERSIVYYVAGNPTARAVAGLLAEDIPTAQVRPMPADPPLDRPLGAAAVALMLGRDAAGRSLAELQAG
jgi:hypothetical protein